jgi:hypothetical protein
MTKEEIIVDQLRQLLHIQSDLRELAENRWQRAQRELVTLLERVAPEEVERRLKNGLPLDSLGVEDLTRLIGQRISTPLRQPQGGQSVVDCSSATKPLLEKIQNDQSEIEKLQTEIRRLGEKMQTSRDELDGYQSLLATLQQIPEKQAHKPNPHPDGRSLAEAPRNEDAPEPDWMADWRKTETFERDAAVLRLLGETGLARRPLIELRLGGSVQDSFNRLEEMGLIESFHPSDPGSLSPDLARLAEHGRLAYMLLSGASPLPNEYEALLARHISPEHTQLYLQAADLLRAASYRVSLFPPDLHLTDGSLFMTDLLAVNPKGQSLYIEVETDAHQNREQRLVQWRSALQANGGRIYIICDSPSSMRSIRSEFNFALGRQAGGCYLTNLADLQAGKRAQDGGIWLDTRPDPAAS